MTKLKIVLTGLYLIIVAGISCNKIPSGIDNTDAVGVDKNALAIEYAAGDDADSVKIMWVCLQVGVTEQI